MKYSTLNLINKPDSIQPLKILMADNLFLRLRGLLGRTFENIDGLALIPCNSIHTMFMAYSIDVVFIDKKGRILKVIPEVKPWTMFAAAARAKTVLELPAGAAQSLNIEPGDICEFVSAGN